MIYIILAIVFLLTLGFVLTAVGLTLEWLVDQVEKVIRRHPKVPPVEIPKL